MRCFRNSANKKGQLRQYNPNDDVEVSNYNYHDLSERQIVIQSQCPILDGVVSTRWGEVSAGNVIAGIAAGAQPQTIPITELAKGSIINQPNIQSFVTALYPATLSGKRFYENLQILFRFIILNLSTCSENNMHKSLQET